MKELLQYKIAYTHGGAFHLDDVLCSAMLMLTNPQIKIERVLSVFDIKEDSASIVFDMGGGEFDHHQKAQKLRENGNAYSAFGLMWQKFGIEFIRAMGYNGNYCDRLFAYMDTKFVSKVDIIDSKGYLEELNFPEHKVFLKFKAYWHDDAKETHVQFFYAVEYGKLLLRSWLREAYSMSVEYDKAKAFFESACKQAAGKNYIYTHRYIPCKTLFKEEMLQHNIYIHVYPGQRSGYVLESMDTKFANFNDDIFAEDSQTIFKHTSGFLMVVETKECAIELARKFVLSVRVNNMASI